MGPGAGLGKAEAPREARCAFQGPTGGLGMGWGPPKRGGDTLLREGRASGSSC